MHNLNILICDDDSVDIKLFKTYLKSNDDKKYTIIEASTEKEIADAIELNRNNLDVIFIDYNMPGKSGIDWIEELRDQKIAPIIMLTGFGDETTAVNAMKQGAADYIPKDKLNKYELNKIIENTLAKWELQKERDGLIGIAAHELRNPLATIHGYAQILENYGNLDQDKLKEIYTVLRERSEHMLDIINSILNLTRIDKGTIKIEKVDNDLVAFLKSKIFDFMLTAQRKGIKINFINDSHEVIVPFDSNRMDEVINNLIDNAIKFSPANSVVEIKVYGDEKSGSFEVRDAGKGIKPEELKHIFRLFSNVKISSTPTAGESSNGLGLAICKKIIDLHDGEISVNSEVNRGTTFIVKINK